MDNPHRLPLPFQSSHFCRSEKLLCQNDKLTKCDRLAHVSLYQFEMFDNFDAKMESQTQVCYCFAAAWKSCSKNYM